MLKICSACSVIIANGFVMSWRGRSMIEYACTIYTIYSSAGAGTAAAAANCWIRSSNNALTSV